MGKLKIVPNKSLQLLQDEPKETTLINKGPKASKDIQQVYLQQSVTLLAFKDKTSNNGTIAPDVLHPKLLFGIVAEDVPLFIGAVIGASLILALCLLILTFWKCCCRMTILNKKKEYWLDPKDSPSIKGKHKIPVVQSNSVVFLGLKPTHIFDYKREKSSEDCALQPLSTISNQDLRRGPYIDHHINMSAQNSDISENEKHSLPSNDFPENLVNQSCSVISVPPVLNSNGTNFLQPSILSQHEGNSPNVVIHEDSPALFHQGISSSTFDQHSLYSCESHMGSELDLKTCSLTWSNYNLWKSSNSDCYYDNLKKASVCKKRKNRMRSDIAAAIALNRSQSCQMNKDTEALVENEVEVIIDERTTL